MITWLRLQLSYLRQINT